MISIDDWPVRAITSNADSFVSQRAHGVMWELMVPEPTALGLTAIGLGALALVRRRGNRG